MMYTEKWGLIVSDWLFEDQREKKKLHRTNKQIFIELLSLNFRGSYRTVCNFVKEWRNDHGTNTPDTGYERLEHPPGEAQVDFGVMEAVEDGKTRDIKLLIMSFPFSNAAFFEPLPSENQECFLEGMQHLFHQIGAVPKKIRIDNLTPAVKKTRSKTEEAELTDDYYRFQHTYGFDTQVCNVRKGNEKGHVEKKVGYIRYNFFSVPPIITGLDDLSQQLQAFSKKDHERLHYTKSVVIQSLFEEELVSCLALPAQKYPVRKEELVKVNSYNEVRLDDCLIHIPKAKNYLQLYQVKTWDQYKIVTPDGEIILEGYRPYMSKRKELPWLRIFKDWLNKPRAINYSRYFKYLPGRIQNYLDVPSHQVRQLRVKEFLSLLVRFQMEEINERFYDLLDSQKNEADHPYDVDWKQYDQLTELEADSHV